MKFTQNRYDREWVGELTEPEVESFAFMYVPDYKSAFRKGLKIPLFQKEGTSKEQKTASILWPNPQ
jgi:hypothetical protein